ncbi:MAG: BatA domain-containing protein [Planctomyces sp.]|nr:BatA domain-containing protein [Planctomyces sp.]
MTLINSTLIAGMALAVLPIILHMVMRAKPKRIEFPALRLLKSRQPANARRMQLKHWLLLFLRSLLIILAVLCVARPSLPAARYGLQWWEWTLVVAIAGVAVAAYYLLGRKDPDRHLAVHVLRDVRNRRRLWCVLGGFLAVLVVVGIPWGLRVRSEMTSPMNEAAEDIPVAVVFIFDNSVSMNYRHENLTRLERAREVAIQYLSQLPQGSRVAIAGLAPDEEVVFQADLASAQARIDSLPVTYVPDPINRRLRESIEAHVDDRDRLRQEAGVQAGDFFAREICLLTDLSVSAWSVPDEVGLMDLLVQQDHVQLYVVDVSVEQPVNSLLTALKLSDQTTVAGREVVASVTASGTVGQVKPLTIEAFLLDSDGNEIRVGPPRTAQLDNGPVEVQIPIACPPGSAFAQGLLRIQSDDPLPDDNIQHFTVAVRAAPKILLISDRREESLYIKNALEPEDGAQWGSDFYDCTEVTTSQFNRESLDRYDVVCVINCQRPDPSMWTALKSYAEAGKGVFVVAGNSGISVSHWSTPEAAALLPGTPIQWFRYLDEPGRIRLVTEQHPMTKPFAEWEEARTVLGASSFLRCWAMEWSDDSSLLMVFDGPGNRPALAERRLGDGKCLLFTSAMDNLVNGGSEWNDFVVDNWSFLMFCDVLVQHLTGASEQQRNFTAGKPVEISVPATERFAEYRVSRPGFRRTPGELSADQTSLLISDAVDPGHYRVTPFESASVFEAAFSMTLRDQETDLTQMTRKQLEDMLGAERFSLVHNPTDLERAVRVGRLGIEVFPVLIGLLLLVFCAEHLMANFFYDEQPASLEKA